MIQIRNLKITHQKDLRVLVDDFTCVIHRGEKIGLIGDEGTGKSTLLKCLILRDEVQKYAIVEGEIQIINETIGYLPQQLSEVDCEKTVYEYMCEEEGFLDIDQSSLYDILVQLQLDYSLIYSEQKMSTLSGGEKIRISLARILCQSPTIVLLDEPSNDIDLETLHWMQDWLQNTNLGVVFISHDETLLRNVATKIIHLELLKRRTQSAWHMAELSYDEYMQNRDREIARQKMIVDGQQREDKKRMEKLRQIKEKVAYRQATITRADAHGGQLLKKKMRAVKAMEKRFSNERETFENYIDPEQAILFHFSDECIVPPQKKILAFHLDELKIDERILAKNVELNIFGPKKVCIVGNNGCGKSTLLRKIEAELKQRDDIHCFYMPQNYSDVLNVNVTPIKYLIEQTGKSEKEVRLLLGAMRYTTDEMTHAIDDLSGGQQAKLLFVAMNLSKANVLLLDEPTRNFSPLSKPVILAVLKAFKGTIISVSHDRTYISEVCDEIWRLDTSGLQMLKKDSLLSL